MRWVDKIIFRGVETYQATYTGNVLDYRVREVDTTDYLSLTSPTLPMRVHISIPSGYSSTKPNVEYSIDKKEWYTLDEYNYWRTEEIPAGVTAYFRGYNPRGWTMEHSYSVKFDIQSGSNVILAGNVMTLIDLCGNTDTIPCDDCFSGLFYGNSKLVDASNFKLPATSIRRYCYAGLFNGCTALTKAPSELPNTTKVEFGTYNSMFANTKITSTPILRRTTLSNLEYQNMFANCRRLSEVKCYIQSMTTYMNLPSTDHWLDSVNSTGTFYNYGGYANFKTGASGIPSGWTVRS